MILMMLPNDNRCAVPFEEDIVINLDDGATSPCCKLPSTPLDPVNGVLNKTMLDVRQAIKDNVRSHHCKHCWDIIDRQGLTRRPFSNHSEMDWNALDIMQPVKNVQINFSKTCQLQCVYCGPWASTTWQKNLQDYTEFKKYTPLENKNTLLQDIIDVSLLKSIHISGGEPMMDNDCIRFLEELPFDAGRRLSIVTNLSYGPSVFNKLFNIIQHHKNIKLALSLDAVGENVSRKYFNWDLWSNNLNLLMIDLQSRLTYTTAKIVVRITVNALNYKETKNVVDFVLSYRKQGLMGLTFSMGTLFKDELASMWSTDIDKSAKIVLSENDITLLDSSEKYEIEQFNIMLDNATVDELLNSSTQKYIQIYSR
jgi:organic radical activating enzyme